MTDINHDHTLRRGDKVEVSLMNYVNCGWNFDPARRLATRFLPGFVRRTGKAAGYRAR